MPNRVFIDQRKVVVETQTRIGDWEVDTIRSNIDFKKAEYAMERLNNRPRKKLGFKTPFEVFFKRK